MCNVFPQRLRSADGLPGLVGAERFSQNPTPTPRAMGGRECGAELHATHWLHVELTDVSQEMSYGAHWIEPETSFGQMKPEYCTRSRLSRWSWNLKRG